jgi:hypothetical protein
VSSEVLGATWSHQEQALTGTAAACWDEYIASRLSARYGNDETLCGFEDGFCARLEAAWPAIVKSIKQYRMHGDVPRVLSEVTGQIRNVALYAGYLLGHLDGIERSLAESAPKAVTSFEQHKHLGSFVVPLHKELDLLFDGYEDFSGLEWFLPLRTLVDEMFRKAGLILSETNEGTHVSIPYRNDTLPNAVEQMEFINARNESENAFNNE